MAAGLGLAEVILDLFSDFSVNKAIEIKKITLFWWQKSEKGLKTNAFLFERLCSCLRCKRAVPKDRCFFLRMSFKSFSQFILRFMKFSFGRRCDSAHGNVKLFTHPLYQGSVLIYWEPVMIFLSCFLERNIFLLLCLIYVMKLLVNFNSFWKISIYFESLISPIKELLLTKLVPSSVMNVVISCI